MKPVYVVEVDGAADPALPQACVVCGKAAGEVLRTLPLSDEYGRVEFYFYGIVERPAQGRLLPVPIHDRCARALRNRFLKRLLPAVAVAGVVGAAGIWLGLDDFWTMAAVLVAAGRLFYRALGMPVPMEFWHSGSRIVLVFADRDFAQRVARLNGAQVVPCTRVDQGVPVRLEVVKRAGTRD
jgi:hypothetical protein